MWILWEPLHLLLAIAMIAGAQFKEKEQTRLVFQMIYSFLFHCVQVHESGGGKQRR
jgi:hypothetical protein